MHMQFYCIIEIVNIFKIHLPDYHEFTQKN